MIGANQITLAPLPPQLRVASDTASGLQKALQACRLSLEEARAARGEVDAARRTAAAAAADREAELERQLHALVRSG